MFYTIYKITNKLNGKYYIGKHQTKNLDDGYMGSGKLIVEAIKKHGIDNFKKEILFIFDNELDMNNKEKEVVDINEMTYNLCTGGQGGFSYINKNINLTERNRKISASRDYNDPVFRKNHLEAIIKSIPFRKKPTYTEESRLRMTNSFTGKTHTEESKRKISEKNKILTGKRNSQYGTFWITNGHHNKKIKNEELDFFINLGYYKGRIINKE
jgi:group I intron endonuclease